MQILSNAILSIQMGLEDLEANTLGRNLSGVRNPHSGVLLLLKARLQELSPEGSDEVLLKQRISPRKNSSGTLDFIGTGKKTVDAHEIRQRLSALGVTLDWKRLERLTAERNNIEHYYPQVSHDALRGIATSVLVIVRDFAKRELRREPRELFGDKSWELLLDNEGVYDSERRECGEALGQVAWPNPVLLEACEGYSCPACGAQLMHPVDPKLPFEQLELKCRSCGEVVAEEQFAEGAIHELFEPDRYYAAKKGGVDPLGHCPNCVSETFSLEHDKCLRCGYEREHEECVRYGAALAVDEQELGGVCSYCDHMLSKDE